MTPTERAYIGAYEDAITAVCSVTSYISSAHATQMESLEATMSTERIEELRQIARRRMGMI